MVKVFIKGGIWKNSEDEILKAAVMKYGLNNWSRVASLLVRKSAKQCKARWYEWLDPSIKKVEWTREEEEKLLHLAKLFPTQWRTIAPIIGRTAHQCLEHYEKLLDMAHGKDADELAELRKLRPGEADPNPEFRPAKPDAVDMDDDEKEMLAEARARLANTRGKKAKRKAREKQMEEARRLALIQKKREMTAAGITLPGINLNQPPGGYNGKIKPSSIDYDAKFKGVELFDLKPQAVKFPIPDEETPNPDVMDLRLSVAQIEGAQRDAEEAKLRKDDERKLKRLRQVELPEVLKRAAREADTEMQFKRTKLFIPAPALTDTDLEEIVKLGQSETVPAISDAPSTDRALTFSDKKHKGNNLALLDDLHDRIRRGLDQLPSASRSSYKMDIDDDDSALDLQLRVQAEEKKLADGMVDAEHIRKEAERRKEAEERVRKRLESSVVSMKLPRPLVPQNMPRKGVQFSVLPENKAASEEIYEYACKMVYADAYVHPVKGGKLPKLDVDVEEAREWVYGFRIADLDEAKKMIEEEAARGEGSLKEVEKIEKMLERVHGGPHYVPVLGSGEEITRDYSTEESLDVLRKEEEVLRYYLGRELDRRKKLETGVALVEQLEEESGRKLEGMGGTCMLLDQLRESMVSESNELDKDFWKIRERVRLDTVRLDELRDLGVRLQGRWKELSEVYESFEKSLSNGV